MLDFFATNLRFCYSEELQILINITNNSKYYYFKLYFGFCNNNDDRRTAYSNTSAVALANDTTASCFCNENNWGCDSRQTGLLEEMYGVIEETLGWPASAELGVDFYIPWRNLAFMVSAKPWSLRPQLRNLFEIMPKFKYLKWDYT